MALLRRPSGLYTKARAAGRAELRRRRLLAATDGDAELREAVGRALEHHAALESGRGIAGCDLATKLRQLAKVWR